MVPVDAEQQTAVSQGNGAIAFQSRDITTVAIAVNRTAVGKGSVSKLLHTRPLDIGCHTHFQKARVAPLIQRQCRKDFGLFCAQAPLFLFWWVAKVRIIKFNDATELIGLVPLARLYGCL